MSQRMGAVVTKGHNAAGAGAGAGAGIQAVIRKIPPTAISFQFRDRYVLPTSCSVANPTNCSDRWIDRCSLLSTREIQFGQVGTTPN